MTSNMNARYLLKESHTRGERSTHVFLWPHLCFSKILHFDSVKLTNRFIMSQIKEYDVHRTADGVHAQIVSIVPTLKLDPKSEPNT
jgi:hypothetical protein